MSRYQKDFGLKFNGTGGAFSQPEPIRHDNDPLERILRFAGGVAPGVGTLVGGLGGAALGSMAGGAGAVPGGMLGAGLGGAAGSALGAGLNYGADVEGEPFKQQQEDQLQRENERHARAQAAMGMLGAI